MAPRASKNRAATSARITMPTDNEASSKWQHCRSPSPEWNEESLAGAPTPISGEVSPPDSTPRGAPSECRGARRDRNAASLAE
eukprot:scaffold257837_cov33-Tisochrysis_lutea.AAC.3